jgi:transposase-like protein
LRDVQASANYDVDELLAFYDFPAEHWIHLRATNPIESTFATVNHTKVTKGPGSRAAGLAMAFKLIEAAQDRWRAVNGPHLVARARRHDIRQRQARRTTRRHSSTRSRIKIFIHRS